MAAEKVTEVEMKELTETQDDKDAEKNTMDETKEEEEEEEEEEKQEEEGANVYCRLKNPTEETYSLAAMPPSSPKHTEDVYKEVHLYKRISAVFIILAVLLLAVVLALALKLYEVQSTQKCPESTVFEELNCSHDLCQTMYPSTQAVQSQGYQCSGYGKGWGRFENSCYFKSKERLSWQESRAACQKQGGDLAVISNERVQKFLTRNSKMLYWIGLGYSETQQWMWINNSAPTQNYWSLGQPNPDSQGSCALLNGGTPQINNWFSNSCKVISHYICQRL